MDTTLRPLPAFMVLLIGLAVLLLWIGVFLVIVGMTISGDFSALTMDSIIPTHVDDIMHTALVAQYLAIFLNLLLLFVMGNLICGAWIFGAHSVAVTSAIWLVRLMIGLMIVQLFTSAGIPFAVGGFIGAAPGILTQLPLLLVSIAFLILGERVLVRSRTGS